MQNMALRTFSIPNDTHFQIINQLRLQVTCRGLPENAFTLDVSATKRIHVLSGIPWDTTCTLRRICDDGVSAKPLSFEASSQEPLVRSP